MVMKEEFRVYSTNAGAIPLVRPCVDCGQITGNWCNNECHAIDQVPFGDAIHESWNPEQITPHCTVCDTRCRWCHFCRGMAWCSPDVHRTIRYDGIMYADDGGALSLLQEASDDEESQ